MLPPDYLVSRADDITAMYADLHTSILIDIAKHIRETLDATGKADIIPSAAYKVLSLNRLGMARQDIIDNIAEINKMSRAEIRRMFKDAAIQTRIYDDRVYKAAGLSPAPVMQSPEMARVLDAGIKKTLGSIERLTGSMAINAETRFNELLNLAYNKTVSGAISYDRAIADAMDDLAREGVNVFSYESGRSLSIETAVRMNVLTGANQTTCEISRRTMLDLGVSLVRTSAHLGARNKGDVPENHEKWQGGIFHWKELEQQIPLDKLVKYTGKYEDFIETTGYMVKAAGLAGPHCRHSFGSYIEGLSIETYSQADLDEYANETVTYNGKELSYYEATQIQRKLERGVRKWKRRLAVKSAANVNADVEGMKVRDYQKRLVDFTKQTGLKRYAKRERIAQP